MIHAGSFHSYLLYDPDSPSGLRWKVNRGGKAKAGTVAGRRDKRGCWQLRLNGTPYLVHRVIWCILTGELRDDDEIDHIDGNPSNNVRSNLRIVSRPINSRNRPKRSDNKTGKTGVTWSDIENRYRVYWVDNGNARSKSFSVKRYGDRSQAFDAATAFRVNVIQALNQQGAGYTERHGE